MNLLKTYLLAFCTIFAANISAQVIHVNSEDIIFDTHDLTDLGDKLEIKNNDSTLLKPGKYVCRYSKRKTTRDISFTINDQGLPHGFVLCDTMFKISVNNGIIQAYESYYPGGKLRAEGFLLGGDTIVEREYNKYAQLRSEYKKSGGETVYRYGCDYSAATDSLSCCEAEDKIKGITIDYNKDGSIYRRTLTKGLPAEVDSITETYDEGNIRSTEIVYKGGKVKAVQADGSYTLTTPGNNGNRVEEYDKHGKLMNSYNAAYIMAPSL